MEETSLSGGRRRKPLEEETHVASPLWTQCRLWVAFAIAAVIVVSALSPLSAKAGPSEGPENESPPTNHRDTSMDRTVSLYVIDGATSALYSFGQGRLFAVAMMSPSAVEKPDKVAAPVGGNPSDLLSHIANSDIVQTLCSKLKIQLPRRASLRDSALAAFSSGAAESDRKILASVFESAGLQFNIVTTSGFPELDERFPGSSPGDTEPYRKWLEVVAVAGELRGSMAQLPDSASAEGEELRFRIQLDSRSANRLSVGAVPDSVYDVQVNVSRMEITGEVRRKKSVSADSAGSVSLFVRPTEGDLSGVAALQKTIALSVPPEPNLLTMKTIIASAVVACVTVGILAVVLIFRRRHQLHNELSKVAGQPVYPTMPASAVTKWPPVDPAAQASTRLLDEIARQYGLERRSAEGELVSAVKRDHLRSLEYDRFVQSLFQMLKSYDVPVDVDCGAEGILAGIKGALQRWHTEQQAALQSQKVFGDALQPLVAGSGRFREFFERAACNAGSPPASLAPEADQIRLALLGLELGVRDEDRSIRALHRAVHRLLQPMEERVSRLGDSTLLELWVTLRGYLGDPVPEAAVVAGACPDPLDVGCQQTDLSQQWKAEFRRSSYLDRVDSGYQECVRLGFRIRTLAIVTAPTDDASKLAILTECDILSSALASHLAVILAAADRIPHTPYPGMPFDRASMSSQGDLATLSQSEFEAVSRYIQDGLADVVGVGFGEFEEDAWRSCVAPTRVVLSRSQKPLKGRS